MPRNKEFAAAARELGTLLAMRGHTLVYGGSNLGLMGVVSGAAMAAGGKVTGIIPTLFSEAIINSQPVTQLVRVASMAERKELIIKTCDAFIALPGGIGTIDEVSEVLVANQLGTVRGVPRQAVAFDTPKDDNPMVLVNIDGFYDGFLAQMKLVMDEGLMRSEAGLAVAATAAEALDLAERHGASK
ncbi:MAG: TIGR00730 family Rossman fold protein [Bacteroidales bacterium]|nr:TIGR00730 family Rossman fold protein [Bacteroidales bacterium]